MADKIWIPSRQSPVLPFNSSLDYSFAFSSRDKDNVKNLVTFLQEQDSSIFLIAGVAKNILDNNLPRKNRETNNNLLVPYKEINLAAITPEYSRLSDKIEELGGLKNSLEKPTSETLEIFGNQFLGICVTPRTEVKGLNLPPYSYRFSWKFDDKTLSVRDIVLGIYEYFSMAPQ